MLFVIHQKMEKVRKGERKKRNREIKEYSETRKQKNLFKRMFYCIPVFGGVLGVKCPFCCLKGPLIFSGIMINQSEIVIREKKWVSPIIKWAFDSKMCLWSQMGIFSKLGGIFFL